MARKQTDVPFGEPRLRETIQGGGQTPVVMPKVPQDNSMLQLSRGLSQFSNILGQYSNIQIKRGQDTAAVMSTDEVIAAIEKQQEQDKIPLTERIGFQKGYSQQLYSRYLETKVIPMFNDLSTELANINADEFEAKGVDDFDDFIAGKVKEIEDKALGYIGDNPFQMQVHNAAFEPVKTKFSIQERDKYIKKQSAWAASREQEILNNDIYNLLNSTQAGDEPLTEGLEGADDPVNFDALFEDKIDEFISNYEGRSGPLNVGPTEKTKSIHSAVVGAVSTFVNLPDSDMPERFDKAKLFLEVAGRKIRFKSQAGQAALAAAYKTIDAAEAKFERDNENLPADIVKDLMFDDGIRKNLEALANNIEATADFNGQTFDNLNSYAQELFRTFNVVDGRMYGGSLETQIAFRKSIEDFLSDYDTKVSDKARAYAQQADSANFILGKLNTEQIYKKAFPTEQYGNNPEFYTTKTDDAFNEILYPNPSKFKQVQTQIEVFEGNIIANELYEEADNYVRLNPNPTPSDRNTFIQSTAERLAEQAFDPIVNSIRKDLGLPEVTQSAIIPKPQVPARRLTQEYLEADPTLDEKQANIGARRDLARRTENTFEVDENGNLIIKKDDSIFDFDRGKLLGFIDVGANYEIEDILQFEQKYQNTRNLGLFEGKLEDLDTVFKFHKDMVKNSDKIVSILDALNPQLPGFYSMSPRGELFDNKPSGISVGERIRLQRSMRELLKYGIEEDDAAQGYVEIKRNKYDLENALRSSKVATETMPGMGQSFGWQVIPVLDYDSIQNKNIDRVIQKVQTIIDMNNLVDSSGKKLTAAEFIEAQELLFQTRSLPDTRVLRQQQQQQ